jgi:radical SAM protein
MLTSMKMKDQPALDYDRAPFLVIWETTQACELVCTHCRASAQPRRDPFELSISEGFDLIDSVAAMGTPLMIFSGGDPLNRPDLCDLIRRAKRHGMRAATIPAATGALERSVVRDLKQAGLDQMALSLDLPDAARHDAFRGVLGSFERTMRAVEWAHAEGLALQINTTLCGSTAASFDALAALVRGLNIVFWEIFFLVPVGRGALLAGLSASDCEALFARIHAIQKRERFVVKVTEAPHYRRHVAQREAGASRADGRTMPALLTRSEGPGRSVGLAPRGVNAGNGFVFISHIGEVFPSGFLPLSAGNARSAPLSDIYRNAPLLKGLRSPDALKGRCGRCEYRFICGGSRSRAYALTGDPLESDPWCGYEPAEVELMPKEEGIDTSTVACAASDR